MEFIKGLDQQPIYHSNGTYFWGKNSKLLCLFEFKAEEMLQGLAKNLNFIISCLVMCYQETSTVEFTFYIYKAVAHKC
jgi:hypothetical protein